LTVSSLKDFSDKIIDHAKKYKNCLVCERDMNNAQLQKFLSIQQEKLQKAPEMLLTLQKDLQEAEKECSSLKELLPLQQDLKNLKEFTLLELQKSLSDVKSQLEADTKNIKELKNTLEGLEEELKTASAHLLDFNGLSSLSDQIAQMELTISKERVALTRSTSKKDLDAFETLQKRRDADLKQVDSLNIKQDNLIKEKEELDNRLNYARDFLQQKKLAAVEGKNQLATLKGLMNDIEKLSSEIIDKQNSLQSYEADLPSAEEAQERLKMSTSDLRKIFEQKEKQLLASLENLQKESSFVKSLVKDIQKYGVDNKEEEIQAALERKQKVEILLQQATTNLQMNTRTFNEKMEMISKREPVRMNLLNNRKYREKAAELQRKQNTCLDWKNKLDLAQLAVAGGDSSNLLSDVKDYESLKIMERQLLTKKAEAMGRLRSDMDKMKILEKETKEGQNEEKKFVQSVINLETYKAVCQDLDTYHNALSLALMEYHRMKMEEINSIIRELWQKIYRGQDIDTIEIRCFQTTMGKRETIQYRVIMVKNGIDLETRGRCSAGQKVLASLIIRLALAEAFCLGCGVIALDEPTTNLDIQNIASLAHALQVIIQDRRRQANFQLIIITHDEDFVAKLGRSELVDSFYRISKDPGSQCSRIDEVPFLWSNNNNTGGSIK